MESLATSRGWAPATSSVRGPWPLAARRLASTAVEVARCGLEITRESTHDWRARVRAARLQEASLRVGARLGLDVEIRGQPPREPAVLVANHLSYLDPIAIAQVLRLSAIAKSEVLGWPTVGAALDRFGILFVRREDPGDGAVALRKAMRLLEGGVSVLVFPEGTTTHGDEVLPFRRGAFGLARLCAVPVVPIALEYDARDVCWVGDTGFLPHFFSLHRYDRVVARLSFATPLHPQADESAEALAEAARKRILELLNR